MNVFATIQQEFLKMARNWDDLSFELQKGYLYRHPGSHRHITAKPPIKSPTSGLAIHDPTRARSRVILDTLRNATNSDGSDPIERNYMTMREGPHNKFHYFGVFKTKNGQYAAANSYGRIGYDPKATVFEVSPSKQMAINALYAKIDKKLKKGYKQEAIYG
ncbi:MAG: WGR domain-containing protein [Nitrosarchaeum sp.]|nr:WGR domain-containing protein [Nitrosarchaeum sp.]